MEYRLLYNAAAHFESLDRYPDGLVSAVSEPGKDGFDALCYALDLMSHQAEAHREMLGMSTQEPITYDWIRTNMRLTDVVAAKTAVFEAIAKGLGEPSGEVDEVLLELQKKTETNLSEQNI